MGAFDAIDISATGLRASSLWLDVIGHNVANANTVRSTEEEPFRSFMVRLAEERRGSSLAGGGVQVVALDQVAGEPTAVYDPTHPLADEEGRVLYPIVDMAVQMTDLIIANRSYQLNVRALQSSQEAYKSALKIGRS